MVRTKEQVKEFSILRLRVNRIKRHTIKTKSKTMFPFITAALRGVAKGLPAINAIVEAVKNRKVGKVIKSAKQEIEQVSNLGSEAPAELIEVANTNLPHHWVSILFQFITVAIVIYSFFTKQLTAETVVNFLKDFSAGF